MGPPRTLDAIKLPLINFFYKMGSKVNEKSTRIKSVSYLVVVVPVSNNREKNKERIKEGTYFFFR